MGFWKKIFKTKNKPVDEVLLTINCGDFIIIEFKTSKDIGIVSGQDLAMGRLNPKEAQERKIKGSVVRKWKDPGMKTTLIEVITYTSPDMLGVQRKITFLEDEIASIRKINE